ncbi:putative E3 ubiquitin-protein ligase bre1-like isoform X2 [Dinothrombium tinctorium]|uniref:Putative E3 ubiquitin-protein ligase bre1-like isoform X2 n=1 Tax=Dinothrombium tinctorium TaxID=1965070 RepID=A0A3S3PIV7_9ACAR|nr:putative E3 ubiquitin-protein ligase bre1-like isoform X2 [Dinothrombium tinctorium]
MNRERIINPELETSDEWTILNPTDGPMDECTQQADDEGANMASLDSSGISAMSSLSFLRSNSMTNLPSYQKQYTSSVHDDMSDNSSILYKEMDISPGIRAYKHTPNKKMSVKLNLLLAFAVTAVIFLAVGNYIGWTDNVSHHNQLTMGQIQKLRNLQDELVLCMQNQEKAEASDKQLKICYQNSDYWRAKFEKLFKENHGLKDILEKTQKHYWSTGHHKNIVTEKECSAVASDEFHKLKLDLIVKQMEHLQLLKTFEEVKYQEKVSKMRLSKLEEENADLRAKLREEEEDDKVIVETMEERISKLAVENEKLRDRLKEQEKPNESENIKKMEAKINELMDENNELKSALKQMQSQMDVFANTKDDLIIESGEDLSEADEPEEDSFSVHEESVKVDDLRERINQMVTENEELKSIIARLRWSKSYIDNHETQENTVDVSSLQKELNEIRELLINEQEETKKWKNLYEEMRKKSENKNEKQNVFKSWWDSINVTQLTEKFPNGAAFSNVLQNVLKKATENNVVIPDEIYRVINATQNAIVELHQQLVAKWEEMESLGVAVDSSAQKIKRKMAELLDTSMRKLQEAGDKFASNQKPFESRVHKLTNKLSKIKEWLDLKWTEMREKYAKQRKNDAQVVDGNWYFERSKRDEPLEQSTENWMIERARDREIQRIRGEEEVENWYLKKEVEWRTEDDLDYDYPKTSLDPHLYSHNSQFLEVALRSDVKAN